MDFLPSDPVVLAVWLQSDHAAYLDLVRGTKIGERVIDKAPARDSAQWPGYLKSLLAPNGVHLPVVRTRTGTLFNTPDGTRRIYHMRGGTLEVITGETAQTLEVDEKVSLIAIDCDVQRELIAALDQDANIHLYRDTTRIGVFPTGLALQDDVQPQIAVAADGSALFAGDGRQIVMMDAQGNIQQRLTLHYTLGAFVCGPNGRRLVTSDLDAEVIRVYSGPQLEPTHQRFAVDLLTEARRVKNNTPLIPASGLALGPLALDERGALAFAVSGVVCVSSLARLKTLPRAQPEPSSDSDQPDPPDPLSATDPITDPFSVDVSADAPRDEEAPTISEPTDATESPDDTDPPPKPPTAPAEATDDTADPADDGKTSDNAESPKAASET
ncbi:MAG: hypothetical protein GYB67_01185 [Chloroflexi bacterium]|nr:hypothetical protein [Chloroflexota bacterium]